MLQDHLTALGSWTGYSVDHVDDSGPQATIQLLPVHSRYYRCSGCGRFVRHSHDYRWRTVRDLPAFGKLILLHFQRRRVHCRRCGPKLEYLDWIKPDRRATSRLETYVADLCSRMSVKDASVITGLKWDTVKRIDKAYLEDHEQSLNGTNLRILGMDEFAIQRGHRYATVIVNLENGQVLWVGRGRSRADIRPFFEQIGPRSCSRIEAVAMDQSAAYGNELAHWCPQAEIVYDLFHVVTRYGHHVIDRVRVDEANRLRDDRKARKVIKGSRWLLLRNLENVRRPEDQVRLRELLAANRNLAKVYILKDELKQLWSCRSVAKARERWNSWYRKAVYSRIKPLVRFAKNLKEYLPGILAHARWAIHTSVIEGINNKIKVIKRRAYGFRDDEYFFLKIKAAFHPDCG